MYQQFSNVILEAKVFKGLHGIMTYSTFSTPFLEV